MAMKSILIVEDETLVAQSLAQIVMRKMSELIETCDVVQTAAAALKAMAEKHYDLVLVDVRLPDTNGFEVAKVIRKLYRPNTRILMLSAHCTPYICHQLKNIKVDGFVHKLESMEVLVDAIQTTLRKRKSFCSNYTEELEKLEADEFSFDKMLGRREIEVLQYLVRGMRDSEVAAKMDIAPRTVEAHRYNMLKKLKLQDRTALLEYANEVGIF